jgi:hypothetical protein
MGPTWSDATGWDTVEDWVDDRLRSRWGAEGGDFDQDGLSYELRETLNEGLPDGWALDDDRFVGPDPLPANALDIVRDAIDGLDFWDIAQSYDNGD